MAYQKTWTMSRAARGQSERWIRQQYNAAIKAANDRIKTLSKPEYEGRAQAYEHYVKGDLAGAPYVKERGGQTVFKALPRGSSREQSLEALRMVERFLGAKTSTARGILDTEKIRHDRLNEFLSEDFKAHGSGEGESPQLSKDEADGVLRWLGSEEGKTAKETYDSNQVRESVSKAVIAKRGTGKSVSDLYQDWFSSQETLADWIRSSEETIGGYNAF